VKDRVSVTEGLTQKPLVDQPRRRNLEIEQTARAGHDTQTILRKGACERRGRAHHSSFARLKTKAAKVDGLVAQVAALTAENKKLKAAPPPPPAKGKKKR
jgi:hypothetical protein